jgi:protein-L-isoaspartate(D-aspartate) O-methyltransferase
VHIGAGTGYYTAILAALVGESGRVVAYEVDASLASQARENLKDLARVSVVAASATEKTLPSADIVYVSAGATHPVASWLDALNVGGRLIFPLTPNEGFGCMLLVTRHAATSYAATLMSRVKFIPCIGARDDDTSKALSAALEPTNPVSTVKSLQRGTQPDSTAWCIGKGWWLSTAEPASTNGPAR